jgi:anti-sigma-K factor RskA
VNSGLHEEFVALTALYYSGDLTDEEWALLQVHLAYCEPCRWSFEEYRQITAEVIPAMVGSAAAESKVPPIESASSLRDAEKALLNRVNSTAAIDKETSLPAQRSWRMVPLVLAASLVLAGALACVHYVRHAGRQQPATAVSPRTAAPIDMQLAATEQDADLRQALQSSQDKNIVLEQQLVAEQRELTQSKTDLAKLQHQVQTDRTAQASLVAQRETLNQQLVEARGETQALHDRMAEAETTTHQQMEELAALQGRMRNLQGALEEATTALDTKDRMLASDKEFLEHDRDIRDLIGARNLYIADIFDTNEEGKTAKPFGRIFYTRDRSLVFYGFDLEKQAGLKRSVAFQVWGSGSDKPAVSLGLFYQDDSQKRWVLRCNDAKTLARLNMVFVTVEPPGGSSKPTGKQLLRAYLQIASNHP